MRVSIVRRAKRPLALRGGKYRSTLLSGEAVVVGETSTGAKIREAIDLAGVQFSEPLVVSYLHGGAQVGEVSDITIERRDGMDVLVGDVDIAKDGADGSAVIARQDAGMQQDLSIDASASASDYTKEIASNGDITFTITKSNLLGVSVVGRGAIRKAGINRTATTNHEDAPMNQPQADNTATDALALVERVCQGNEAAQKAANAQALLGAGRDAILRAAREAMPANETRTPSAPAVKTGGEPCYSVSRALTAFVKRGAIDGYEGECQAERENLFGGALGGNGVLLRVGGAIERAATTTTAAPITPTDTLTGDTGFIPLREAVVSRLGVTYRELSAKGEIPISTAKPTAAFVAEGAAVPAYEFAGKQRTAKPRRIGLQTGFSVEASAISSVDSVLTQEITRSLAEGIENAVINGDGTGANPSGLLSLTAATDATASTPDKALSLGSDVLATGNAIRAAIAKTADTLSLVSVRALTSNRGGAVLEGIPALAGGTDTAIAGAGTLAGIPLVRSPFIPNGTGNGAKVKIVLGDFAELFVFSFAAVRLVPDMVSGAATGSVKLTITALQDVVIRRHNGFAIGELSLV